MHPNAAFRMSAREDAIAHVARVGFAHLFGMTPDGPRVAHVPLLVTKAETLRFHLANGNALTAHLDGEPALASVGGPGSYISPNWYAQPADNVPTWNYQAVEIEGHVRKLDWEALYELLELASATFEPRVGENWTMDKMAPARRDAMMRGITGFEMTIDSVRSTDKASQNRSEADARGVVGALERLGDVAGAAAIRRSRGW